MDKNKNATKQANITTLEKPTMPSGPLLTLSMSNKVYLAVSRYSKDNLHYIYSLFCPRMSPTSAQYSMVPDSDISVFKDKDSADVYYQTLMQIKDFQSRGPGYESMADFAAIYIDAFNKKTR